MSWFSIFVMSFIIKFTAICNLYVPHPTRALRGQHEYQIFTPRTVCVVNFKWSCSGKMAVNCVHSKINVSLHPLKKQKIACILKIRFSKGIKRVLRRHTCSWVPRSTTTRKRVSTPNIQPVSTIIILSVYLNSWNATCWRRIYKNWTCFVLVICILHFFICFTEFSAKLIKQNESFDMI